MRKMKSWIGMVLAGLLPVLAGGTGCETGADTTSGSDVGGPFFFPGGAPSKCGGCAVLTVPASDSREPAEIMVENFRPSTVDLSDTVVTFRFWVESEAPDAWLTFFVFNPYIREPELALPTISVDFPVSSALEPTELSLDLSGTEAMGGAGPGWDPSFNEVLRSEYYDPTSVQGIAILVNRPTRDTVLFLDSVTFSTDALPDLSFDSSAEPVSPISTGGPQSKVSWRR